MQERVFPGRGLPCHTGLLEKHLVKKKEEDVLLLLLQSLGLVYASKHWEVWDPGTHLLASCRRRVTEI